MIEATREDANELCKPEVLLRHSMRKVHKQIKLRPLIHFASSLWSISSRVTGSDSFFVTLPSTAHVHSLRSSALRVNDNRRFMSSSAIGDTGSYEDVRQKKQELRKKLRAGMRTLTAADIEEQSKKVWTRVFELPIYQSAKSVGLFLSMPMGEINTDLILQDCVRKGKDIYVPEVGKNFELCDMELRKVILDETESSKDPDKMFHKTWPKNKWKIPEPPVDMPTITAEPGDIDLMIVPGLGFDRMRNRLGQGKGYYDRFIAKMTKDGQKLPLVAVTLKPQFVEDALIPVAEYDRRMDMVVLPDDLIEPSK